MIQPLTLRSTETIVTPEDPSFLNGFGNKHDSRRFIEVMEGIRVKHGVGRPRSRPREVHADSA